MTKQPDNRASVVAAKWVAAATVLAAIVTGIFLLLNSSGGISQTADNGGVTNTGNNSNTATNGSIIAGRDVNIATNGGIIAGRDVNINTNEGILTPGNEPTPQHPCIENARKRKGVGFPTSNTLLVLLGDSFAAGDRFPIKVLEMGGDLLIAVDRDPENGNLIIRTLRVFDETDGRVAQVISEAKSRNEFFVAGVPYIRPKKSADGHSLAVYDRRDKEILSIHFLNKNVVSIQGVFRNHGRVLDIQKDKILFEGVGSAGKFQSICGFNSGPIVID